MEPIQVRNLGNVINRAGMRELHIYEKPYTVLNGRVGMGDSIIYYVRKIPT
jgi:hypothetical protein